MRHSKRYVIANMEFGSLQTLTRNTHNNTQSCFLVPSIVFCDESNLRSALVEFETCICVIIHHHRHCSSSVNWTTDVSAAARWLPISQFPAQENYDKEALCD